MKRKIAALLVLIAVSCFTMTGCTEADQVSTNISKEADNFNVTRKLTVLNARTDTILLELTGTFALKNNSDKDKYAWSYLQIQALEERSYKTKI